MIANALVITIAVMLAIGFTFVRLWLTGLEANEKPVYGREDDYTSTWMMDL